MTDLNYFSEFLSTLFGISREDYIVEKENSDVDITDSNMTEGETIEDIELEIADIMKSKEMSENEGRERRDTEMQLMTVARRQTKNTNTIECQSYVKKPPPDIPKKDYNEDHGHDDQKSEDSSDSTNDNSTRPFELLKEEIALNLLHMI